MTELFYSHVLHYFLRLNLFLQREEPVIAIVYEQVWIAIAIHTHTCMMVIKY